MSVLQLALLFVALVLAAIDLIRSRLNSLTTWAVFVLAVALLLPRL